MDSSLVPDNSTTNAVRTHPDRTGALFECAAGALCKAKPPNGGVGGRCGSRGDASRSSNGCVSLPSRGGGGGGGGGVGGGGHHRSLNSTVAAVIISHALLAVVPMAALEVAVVAVAMRRVCPIAASPCLPD